MSALATTGTRLGSLPRVLIWSLVLVVGTGYVLGVLEKRADDDRSVEPRVAEEAPVVPDAVPGEPLGASAPQASLEDAAPEPTGQGASASIPVKVENTPVFTYRPVPSRRTPEGRLPTSAEPRHASPQMYSAPPFFGGHGQPFSPHPEFREESR